MIESKEPRYLKDLEPAYLGALATALDQGDKAEVARIETALSDFNDVRHASFLRRNGVVEVSETAEDVVYDPSKPLIVQVLAFAAPEIAQALDS